METCPRDNAVLCLNYDYRDQNFSRAPMHTRLLLVTLNCMTDREVSHCRRGHVHEEKMVTWSEIFV